MTLMKRLCKQTFTRGANWFLVLLSIALVLTGCNPGETAPLGTFVDDLGRSITIERIPQRIVSLAPSNTEILFALGLGEEVVGVTDWCDFPPEALDKEKVGAYDIPDIEKIRALNPDLILVAYGTSMDVINTLEGLGLTVFGIKSTDLDDVLNDIRTVGNITGKELEAQALTSEMESRIEAVTDETSELEQRPRVFYIVWHDPLWTAGSETFIHELIEKAGGVNICQNITGYATISIEEVVARNPEVIIASEWSFDWANNETLLEGTDARQNGRIYQGDDDLVQRSGPRLGEGLEWFAYFIHPEIFEEPEG